ncbi:hypothetical protein [Clostridium novyi]|uniref:hypothetical protein n=1 Tax=Clostridium novyi TaxID=1542 RepID=UPI0016514E6E|nr:hypothetical protein [Clostridium novyi]
MCKGKEMINLTYGLPYMAKYNYYDNNVYVIRKTKVIHEFQNKVKLLHPYFTL